MFDFVSLHFSICFLAISFRFNRLISTSPFGFHLVNILLHILNCNLVLIVLENYTKRKKIAFIASIIFSCHPIHTVRNVKNDITNFPLTYLGKISSLNSPFRNLFAALSAVPIFCGPLCVY